MFKVELKHEDYICRICDEVLVNPTVTLCCNKYVCYDCFVDGGTTIYNQFRQEYVDSGYNYPCCDKKVEGVNCGFYYNSDWGKYSHHYEMVSNLAEPSVFFLKKLNQTAYKCPEKDCQVNREKLLFYFKTNLGCCHFR